MTCCAMRSGRRMRGTATTLHRRGRIAGGLDDVDKGVAARMTTRALKRDLAALEKDMSLVTLASEARDAARASNARRGNVPQRDRGQSR